MPAVITLIVFHKDFHKELLIYKRDTIPTQKGIVSKVKVAQSCLTLCDPMDYTVHGILQARILKWLALPFSRDLPNPGIEPRSPALLVDSLPAEPPGKPWKHNDKKQNKTASVFKSSKKIRTEANYIVL